MGVVRAVCLAGYLLFNAYIRVHVHREYKLKWGCFSARLAVTDCLGLNARQEGGTQQAHCQWEYNPSGSTTLQTHLAVLNGEGNGTPLQYSCLENPMDGGAWWAAVHGVTKSRIRLSNFTFTFHFHALKKGMATHSSVLAWRIPGTGEPGGLLSVGSHRVRHDWSDLAAAAMLKMHIPPTQQFHF